MRRGRIRYNRPRRDFDMFAESRKLDIFSRIVGKIRKEQPTLYTFLCPICRAPLTREGNSLVCSASHTFDISKYGYVNLLTGSSASVHGDNREMCRARRDFLNAGYYAPLLDCLRSLAGEYCKSGSVLLDAGCGEGYYTSGIRAALAEAGKDCTFVGIDVSKEAATLAAKRDKALSLAVASVYALPIADASVDAVFSLFSPFAREEFLRVLKPGGLLFNAFPGRRHLFSLKEAIYDTPYENEVQLLEVDGFELLHHSTVDADISLPDNASVKALFGMTPYRYKTSSEGLRRLDAIASIDTHIEFECAVYKVRG